MYHVQRQKERKMFPVRQKMHPVIFAGCIRKAVLLFHRLLQNSIRIVATCSRVALPCGSRQVWPPLLAPEIRPSATASAIAFFAQSDTLPASG